MAEGSKPSLENQPTDNYKHIHLTPRSDPRNLRQTICAALLIILLLAGATALTLWLVYRPHKPQFQVVGAAAFALNATALPLIYSSAQFTIVARNPNKRVSISYDRLSIFVSYRNQAITPPLALPPLAQKPRSVVAMSPILGGAEVPVAADVSSGLAADVNYGTVAVKVVLIGRLRWKAGAIRTGRYGVYVKCDVVVALRRGVPGQVPLLGAPDCSVDV